MILIFRSFLAGLFVLVGLQAGAQCYDLLVSQSGDGDYTSVQAAIDAAPDDLTSHFVIYIQKGVYDEKLFIGKNFITLIGEDRDSTIITTAVLRRVWRETNPSDWGAATINIDNSATDLTLAHLTVRNNFADVFPDFPDNNDHTFAIRGGGHRVIILDCNIVTTGGDTLSLWNTNGGMFYHNACYFEGYVDYVAPRGYCYITDSEFFGHNLTASIWHDGSGGEDHKFVIRNSHFDGVQGFPLGRHHRDAAFYLLDCDFSLTMANTALYHTGSDPLQWGSRIYYNNCHRDFFDWSWYADNLDEAPGSPAPEDINALWTFNGEWDPEVKLNGLLPGAFLPTPENAEACQHLEPSLEWVPGNCAEKHLVYFGEEDEPPFAGEADTAVFEPGTLEADKRYNWRVDEVRNGDTITGPDWHFFTENGTELPTKAFDPQPANGSDYFAQSLLHLRWNYQACNADSFRIYFGDSPDELVYKAQQKYPGYFLQPGEDDSTYYWRVDAINSAGVAEGDIWSFTLNPATSSTRDPGKIDAFRILHFFPNPVEETARLGIYSPAPGNFNIEIFDTFGALVHTQSANIPHSGDHSFTLHIRQDLPPGLYFLRLAGIADEPVIRFIHL